MLRQLTTFVRIADLGSISRAARSLHLSVPMASRHLAWLEKELGASLVRRTTRQLDLTDAGRELLDRARVVLSGLEEARQSVRPGPGAMGRLVLAVQPALGLAHIVPHVPAVLAQHPRLQLDLRLEARMVDLLADGVDVAIRAGVAPPDSTSVIARRLGAYELVVCASPSFIEAHGRVESAAELARVPFVVLDTSPRVWEWETANGRESVVPAGRVHTNDFFALRELVLAGLGVGCLPSWLAQEDLRRGRLVRLLTRATSPSVDVVAYYHGNSRGSGPIRALLDFLEPRLRGGAPDVRGVTGARGSLDSARLPSRRRSRSAPIQTG